MVTCGVLQRGWTLNLDTVWTMAWNQWSAFYRTVFTDSRPRPQIGRSSGLPAPLPVFPQPVYPMERGRPYLERQPVVCNHSGYLRTLSAPYSLYRQRPMVELRLTELPEGLTPQVTVSTRLFAEQQRHSVAASQHADNMDCETETKSSSCGDGDHEVSGKEGTMAALSEDETETSDRSTLKSGSSAIAMDDGTLCAESSSVSERLQEKSEALQQTRKGVKNQSVRRCHFCRRPISPPQGAEFVGHLQDISHRPSPVRCKECRRGLADTSCQSQPDHSESKRVASDNERSVSPGSTDRRPDPNPLAQSPSTASLEENPEGGRKRCRSSNPKCAYCEQRFVSRALRDQHARQCDGNPYRCAQCGKACLGRVKLERHMRSHSRSRLSTLKAQEVAKDKQGKAPDPKCAYCQKRFPTRVVRDRHSRLCSSNPYKCPQCGKAFLGMAKLERHVRTHSEGSISQTTAATCTTTSNSSPVSTQGSPVQLTAGKVVPVPSSSEPKCSTKASSYSPYSIEAILQMD